VGFKLILLRENMTDDDITECPLCLEELDLTEKNFQPCQCGYQVCLWCWHNIQENLNGKCPACRADYDPDGFQFTTPDPQELQKAMSEAKQQAKVRTKDKSKSTPHKKSEVERASLQNVRVLQRNLCYVVGLPASIAKEEILKKREHFGKFGRLVKVAVSRKQLVSGGYSFSAYVTFKRSQDAEEAIKTMNRTVLEGRALRATFGTTKYCSYFLRSIACSNPGCLYLHELAKPEDCFTKEDLSMTNAAALAGLDLSNSPMSPEYVGKISRPTGLSQAVNPPQPLAQAASAPVPSTVNQPSNTLNSANKAPLNINSTNAFPPFQPTIPVSQANAPSTQPAVNGPGFSRQASLPNSLSTSFPRFAQEQQPQSSQQVHNQLLSTRAIEEAITACVNQASAMASGSVRDPNAVLESNRWDFQKFKDRPPISNNSANLLSISRYAFATLENDPSWIPILQQEQFSNPTVPASGPTNLP